ncbi:MAG: methylmalonyl-CoA mutase, partial [Mangrovimonas sp.]|nr:methylmalonyl-CoA mutase [Mangrovimonas sp.]
QWKQKIQADLKGADYNDTLIWESPEGIHVKPFYSKEDLPSHLLNSNTQARSWKSCQSIFVSDVEKSNRKALYLLDKGVDSLGFTIPSTDVSLKKLLDQVPNQTPLYLEFQFLSEDYILSALDTLKERPVFYTLDIIG